MTEASNLRFIIRRRDEQITALREALEQDRATVATGINAIKEALRRREWLRLGRGSYEWDDDRWKDEFGVVFDDVIEAMQPLRQVAANWQYCSSDPAEIRKARQALAATEPEESGTHVDASATWPQLTPEHSAATEPEVKEAECHEGCEDPQCPYTHPRHQGESR